jgi:hypothetical protein
MTSNGKVFNTKVVENFTNMMIDIKLVQIGVHTRPVNPN